MRANKNKKVKDRKRQTKITSFLGTGRKETETRTYAKVDTDKMTLIMLNSKKRYLSMCAMTNEAELKDNFLVFGTEPNTSGLNVNGLNRRHTCISPTYDSPRAYIYHSMNLHTWPLPEYSSRDVVTALWDTHNPRLGRLVNITLYWDILDEDIPKACYKAAEYANQNGYKIILGSDTNAHSSLWSCPNTNARGRVFEEFLAINDMDIANKGAKNTFIGEQGHTIIDVTAVSSSLTNYIKEWKVTEVETLRDHKLIQFELSIPKTEKITK